MAVEQQSCSTALLFQAAFISPTAEKSLDSRRQPKAYLVYLSLALGFDPDGQYCKGNKRSRD
jgi:hypothetical protein